MGAELKANVIGQGHCFSGETPASDFTSMKPEKELLVVVSFAFLPTTVNFTYFILPPLALVPGGTDFTR